jgi:hypothetical protein
MNRIDRIKASCGIPNILYILYIPVNFLNLPDFKKVLPTCFDELASFLERG